MNKLLLANRFALNYIITLEETVGVQHQASNAQKRGSKIGKGAKTATVAPVQEQATIQRTVGTICVEINLQRGDNEEEMMKSYQIKLL